MKKYAKLLEETGKLKEAEAALERLNYIYPARCRAARHSWAICYLKTGDATGAVREFQVLVALHPIDAAGSHYNLARAYKAEGQKDRPERKPLTRSKPRRISSRLRSCCSK